MEKMKLSGINPTLFENSFQKFKRFVKSDFEYDIENQELITSSFDFDKWHLVTLASIYGSDIFLNSNEIHIEEHQTCNINFYKSYDTPNINLMTSWNENIEVNPALLFSADAFLTKKVITMLSEQSKNLLRQTMPTFNFEQSVYVTNEERKLFKHFAYLITNNTLVFIQDNETTGEITNLFKVRWHEI